MKKISFSHKLLWLLGTAAFLYCIFLAFLIFSNNTDTFTSIVAHSFWVNISYMGDAFFAFALVFFLLFFISQKDVAIKLLGTIFFTLLTVQMIKNIFSQLPLQLYFEETVVGNNLNVHILTNYISSHTAIASAIAGFFVLHFSNKWLKIAVVMVAILVGYSRMLLANETLMVQLISILPALFALFMVNKILYAQKVVYTHKLHKHKRQHNLLEEQYLSA